MVVSVLLQVPTVNCHGRVELQQKRRFDTMVMVPQLSCPSVAHALPSTSLPPDKHHNSSQKLAVNAEKAIEAAKQHVQRPCQPRNGTTGVYGQQQAAAQVVSMLLTTHLRAL